MKTWQKYLYIYIPIGIFCCLINFCAKKDSKTPYVEYHLLHDFEKNEYSAKDLYAGTTIGEFIFSNDNEQSFFDLHAEEISGSFMVGSRENYYQYPKIEFPVLSHLICRLQRHPLDNGSDFSYCTVLSIRHALTDTVICFSSSSAPAAPLPPPAGAYATPAYT